MPGAFPALMRVRKRPEFQNIQARARRVWTAHCILLLFARDDGHDKAAGPARLGITVSRKIGNAVTRNRAKRLIRAAFRETRELWQPGIDLVVIVRHALSPMKCADLVEEWRGASRLIARRSEDARKDRTSRRVRAGE